MERWQLSTKELSRYSVIENAIEGYLKVDQAAEELQLSTRQIFRLKKRLREEGIGGLIHGNRGKPSPRRIPDVLRDVINSLYRGKYEGFNLSHYREMLQGKGRNRSFSRNSKRHPSSKRIIQKEEKISQA